MNQRKAFTLIELTVTMSAGSAMMIMAIGMLHQSMSLATSARERADHQRTLDRLASEFRFDVHRAAKYKIDAEGKVELAMPDEGFVSYQANENHVTRVQPLADGRNRRETFDLNDSSLVVFESLPQPDRVVLTVIHQPANGTRQPRVDRRVAAVVGRLVQSEQVEAKP